MSENSEESRKSSDESGKHELLTDSVIHDLSSQISAAERPCCFNKIKGITNVRGNDSFSLFKSNQPRWFSIQWEGPREQWRMIYSKDPMFSLLRDNSESIDLKSIYINDITSVKLIVKPKIQIRICLSRIVIILTPISIAKPQEIAQTWFMALSAALKLMKLPDKRIIVLRQDFVDSHRNGNEFAVEEHDEDLDSNKPSNSHNLEDVGMSEPSKNHSLEYDNSNEKPRIQFILPKTVNESRVNHSTLQVISKSISSLFKSKDHHDNGRPILISKRDIDDQSENSSLNEDSQTVEEKLSPRSILKHAASTRVPFVPSNEIHSLSNDFEMESSERNSQSVDVEEKELSATAKAILKHKKETSQLSYDWGQNKTGTNSLSADKPLHSSIQQLLRTQDDKKQCQIQLQSTPYRSRQVYDSSLKAQVSIMTAQPYKPSTGINKRLKGLDGNGEHDIIKNSRMNVEDLSSLRNRAALYQDDDSSCLEAEVVCDLREFRVICVVNALKCTLMLTPPGKNDIEMDRYPTVIHLRDILVIERGRGANEAYFKLYVQFDRKSNQDKNINHRGGWLTFRSVDPKKLQSWLSSLLEIRSVALTKSH